jgi:hypothetical protein
MSDFLEFLANWHVALDWVLGLGAIVAAVAAFPPLRTVVWRRLKAIWAVWTHRRHRG